MIIIPRTSLYRGSTVFIFFPSKETGLKLSCKILSLKKFIMKNSNSKCISHKCSITCHPSGKIRRAWWGHTLAGSCKATQDTIYQSKIRMKYIVRMKLALSEKNALGFLYLILYPTSIWDNSMPTWKHLFKVGKVGDTRRHNQTFHGVVGHVYAMHLVLTISLN